MKFVSKNLNLRLVLRPSMSAEPLAGRSAIPGVYVLFQDGVANVPDPELVKLLQVHPGFNSDFVAVSEDEEATLVAKSSSLEPEHDVMEVNYGHAGKTLNPKKAFPMTPEMKKAITDMAIEIAMGILKEKEKKDSAKLTTKASAKTASEVVDEVEEETEKVEETLPVGKKTSK